MINIVSNLIKDSRRHKGSLFMMLIQIVASALIICYGISVCIDGMTMSRQVNHFDKAYSICKLCETLEYNQFSEVQQNMDKRSQMISLAEYIENADDLDYVIADNTTNIALNYADSGIEDRFIKKNSITMDNGFAEMETVRVNDRFFDFFHIKAKKRPYVDDSGAIHVLLGSNFKGNVKNGDVFYDVNDTKYIVEGFVRDGSFFSNPYQNTKTKQLDSYIIAPKEENESIRDPFFELLTTFIIVTDQETGVQNLENELERLDIDWFDIEDYTTHIKHTIIEIWSEIIVILIAAVILGVFASIGTVAMMLNYIDEHMYEFSVHRVCGARKSDIVIRMIMPLFIAVVIAGLITVLLFELNKASISAICLLAVFAIAIIIYPVKVLNRIDIVNELRNRR